MALALTHLDLASVPPGVDLAATGANVCGATDLGASFAALLFGLQTFPDRADLLSTATDDDTTALSVAPPRRRPDDEVAPEADAASVQPQFALAPSMPAPPVTDAPAPPTAEAPAAPRPVAVPVAAPQLAARQLVASADTDPATDATRPPTPAASGRESVVLAEVAERAVASLPSRQAVTNTSETQSAAEPTSDGLQGTPAVRMGADLGAIPASPPPPAATNDPLRAVPTAAPIPEARPERVSQPSRGVSAQPTGPHDSVTGPRQAYGLTPHDSAEVVRRFLVAAPTGDAQHSTVAARTEGDLAAAPAGLELAVVTDDTPQSAAATLSQERLRPVVPPIPTPVTVEVVQTHPAAPTPVATPPATSALTPAMLVSSQDPMPTRASLVAPVASASAGASPLGGPQSPDALLAPAPPALSGAPLQVADSAPAAIIAPTATRATASMTVPAAPAASAALAYALPTVSENPRDVLPAVATPAIPRARRGFLPALPTEAVRTDLAAPTDPFATAVADFEPTAVVSPVPLEPRRDRDEAPTEREPDLPLAALANAVATAEPAPQAAAADAPHVAATAAVTSRETDEPDPVTHLRLRLAPPLLGEVLLDVRHDNGAVTAHAVVSLPATEHVLRQVQTQVQQLLADQGLQAGAFDLTCAFSGTGGGGGGSHLPQPFGVPSGAWAARPEVPDTTPSEASQGPPPGWSRIVDIIA